MSILDSLGPPLCKGQGPAEGRHVKRFHGKSMDVDPLWSQKSSDLHRASRCREKSRLMGAGWPNGPFLEWKHFKAWQSCNVRRQVQMASQVGCQLMCTEASGHLQRSTCSQNQMHSRFGLLLVGKSTVIFCRTSMSNSHHFVTLGYSLGITENRPKIQLSITMRLPAWVWEPKKAQVCTSLS